MDFVVLHSNCVTEKSAGHAVVTTLIIQIDKQQPPDLPNIINIMGPSIL
jgi:hypothetical protein